MTNINNFRLTIIIATFNSEKTLKTALESISRLVYNSWECLIIDGRSGDNTMAIIEDFEKNNTHFRHISEKDNGVYDAFNKGWKEARGQWIYYLGSDDVLISQGLEQMMRIVEKVDDNVGMVSGGVIRISQDGFHRIMITNGFIGSHQSMLMRRDTLEKLKGFDLRYSILADYDLFIRLKNSNYDAINTDHVIAYFNAGGMSEKVKHTIRIFREKMNILQNDIYCKHPLLVSLYDISCTFFGGLYHKIRAMVLTRAYEK